MVVIDPQYPEDELMSLNESSWKDAQLAVQVDGRQQE